MGTKTLGFKGEEFACNLLARNGYKILERNFRCPIGEIDIVAGKGGGLVFVEVKTRKSTRYGLPEEAVTPYKIKKISKVGEWYLKLHPNCTSKVCIDVVSLLVSGNVVTRAKIIHAI